MNELGTEIHLHARVFRTAGEWYADVDDELDPQPDNPLWCGSYALPTSRDRRRLRPNRRLHLTAPISDSRRKHPGEVYSGSLCDGAADPVRGGDAFVHEVGHQAFGGVGEVVAVVHPEAGVVGDEGDLVGLVVADLEGVDPPG